MKVKPSNWILAMNFDHIENVANSHLDASLKLWLLDYGKSYDVYMKLCINRINAKMSYGANRR